MATCYLTKCTIFYMNETCRELGLPNHFLIHKFIKILIKQSSFM